MRTLSKSNRFRTRKRQNASWGYVINLKFSRSKTIELATVGAGHSGKVRCILLSVADCITTNNFYEVLSFPRFLCSGLVPEPTRTMA